MPGAQGGPFRRRTWRPGVLSRDESIDTVCTIPMTTAMYSPVQVPARRPHHLTAREGTERIGRAAGRSGILCHQEFQIIFFQAPGCHRVTETFLLPASQAWEVGAGPAGLLRTTSTSSCFYAFCERSSSPPPDRV